MTTRGLRLTLLATLALFLSTWSGPASARTVSSAQVVEPTQKLVALFSAHEAFSKPARGAPLGRVHARRPLTGERTVLPVLGARGAWLHVELPGRPNGHTGWIIRTATAPRTTRWHLAVETSTRRVIVYRSGRVIRVFKAIVGKPSTPTPHGAFFVEESIELRPSDVGAPFAFALSARSTVLQEFAGGPGQIGLHGLDNIGGVLGTAVSHGRRAPCRQRDALARPPRRPRRAGHHHSLTPVLPCVSASQAFEANVLGWVLAAL